MNEREKMILSDIQQIRVRYRDVETLEPICDALGELLEQRSGKCPSELLIGNSPASEVSSDNQLEVRDRVNLLGYPNVYGKVIGVHGSYACVAWDDFGTKTHQASELELTISDEVPW